MNLPRTPTLSIGLNALAQTRQIGMISRPDGTSTPNRIGVTAAGVDVFAAGWGASLYGELFRDTAETDTVTTQSTQSLGWLVQAGYFIPAPVLRDHLEVVARAQMFDPSDCITRTEGTNCAIRLPASQSREVYRDFMQTLALTFGLNWYQLGHGMKAQATFTLSNELRDLQGGRPGSGVVTNDQLTVQLTGSF